MEPNRPFSSSSGPAVKNSVSEGPLLAAPGRTRAPKGHRWPTRCRCWNAVARLARGARGTRARRPGWGRAAGRWSWGLEAVYSRQVRVGRESGMRRYVSGVVVAGVTAVGALLVASGAGAAAGQGSAEQEVVVLYADGVSAHAAHDAVAAAGGTIVKENAEVGVATVRSSRRDFIADAAAAPAIEGAAHNRVIGSVPDRVTVDRQAKKFD